MRAAGRLQPAERGRCSLPAASGGPPAAFRASPTLTIAKVLQSARHEALPASIGRGLFQPARSQRRGRLLDRWALILALRSRQAVQHRHRHPVDGRSALRSAGNAIRDCREECMLQSWLKPCRLEGRLIRGALLCGAVLAGAPCTLVRAFFPVAGCDHLILATAAVRSLCSTLQGTPSL